MSLITKPVISEKSLAEAAKGKYTFIVDRRANKTEIRKAIEKIFSVNVVKVDTNITKGTTTKMTKKGKSQKKFSVKKALVKLIKGQKIDVFEEKKS